MTVLPPDEHPLCTQSIPASPTQRDEAEHQGSQPKSSPRCQESASQVWERLNQILCCADAMTKPSAQCPQMASQKPENVLELGLWPVEASLSKGQAGLIQHLISGKGQLPYSPLSRADDHNCTDMSGILLASCMAGTTMLLLSCRPRVAREWGRQQGQLRPHLLYLAQATPYSCCLANSHSYFRAHLTCPSVKVLFDHLGEK